jgi:hypothetical protein
MPGSAQITPEPTENQCDCTAAPSSPVSASRATIEYVCTGLSGLTESATASNTENDAHNSNKPTQIFFIFDSDDRIMDK